MLGTHVAISDIRHDVSNTHDVVSGLSDNIMATHAIVTDIHRTVAKSQEEPKAQA